MQNQNRDLLVLLKATSFTDGALEKHIECLNKILKNVENNDAFCRAHELVARIKITKKKNSILKAISSAELKPFYFLINKN